MDNSWFGGLICSTGVGCSNVVGPMQQGMLYSVGLILFNYLTVLLNSQMFAKCCFCKWNPIMPSFVILCTCIFAVWLVEYVICSFLQYSFIRRGVSQWRWWSGGLGLFLVKMPVEWSRHSCSVVCYSFIFRCVECYFLWEELSTSVIFYYLRIFNSYLFVLYYQIVIVCLGWFLDEGLTHM